VLIHGSQATIEDSTFAFNAHYGLYIQSSSDCVVRGNTFVFNGSQGVSFVGAHRMRLEANAIAYNNQKGFLVSWYSGGIDGGLSHDIELRDNLVEHNLAVGMWCDTDCSGVVVGNTVRNNVPVGIEFEATENVIIASNLVVHNSPIGIYAAGGARAVKIFNNTLVGNGSDVGAWAGVMVDEYGPELGLETMGVTLKNNLLSGGTGSYLGVESDRSRRADDMGVVCDYNLYHRTVGSQPAVLMRWWREEEGYFLAHTVGEFQEGASQEENGIGLDDVMPSVLFVNPDGGDYRLAPCSPARGRGEALPQDVADAIGVPATGEPVDIGMLAR
jgi:parallel beta-helix repeat protein